MKKFSGHVKPRQSVVLQRFQFRQRAQQPGETFVTFALALQELASACAFGCWQEELILEQLIDKATDWRIREKLLMELDSLTLSRAVELGSHMERMLQKTYPGLISALTKQWKDWSDSNKIWKIREGNCCKLSYCWEQKRFPALTTKYHQEKQSQFIPSYHSPVSSAAVMGLQHLGRQLSPATSNTRCRRAGNCKVGRWLQRDWKGMIENWTKAHGTRQWKL